MIDAHCHVDALEVGALRGALDEARLGGVVAWVLGGVDPAQWDAGDVIARVHPDVHPTWGVHPWTVAERPERWEALVAALADRLAARPAPIGIGEIGLDHLPRWPAKTHAAQEAAFRAQLRIARRRDLPVVLHVVRAHDAALRVLEEEGVPAAGGLVHSFSGTEVHARRYVDLGLMVSFGPSIVGRPSARAVAAARAVPADHLLVETDAPDQVPRPLRQAGERRGRPAHLVHVVTALAEARGEHPAELGQLTERNARRLFRLPPAEGEDAEAS